jgi:streptomycin 6-kinase
MTEHTLNVPDKVRRTAKSFGAAGEAWLSSLPEETARIARDWSLTLGEASGGGTEAYVVFAKTREGQDAVLKLTITGIDPTRQELRTLKAADGRGYVKLLRADETANVMLLEKLGPQLHALALPEERVMEIISATLKEAWHARPDGPAFATGAERAREFGGVVAANWALLGKPCPERTFDATLAAARRRELAFDPAHSVLAHGDAHEWNTLQALGSTTGFKFVDPDGAFAERAFDLAIPMREWGAVMPAGDPLALGRRRCELLSGFTGVARDAIWDWSLIQLVWNSFLLLQVGLDQPAIVSLAMADAWVEGGVFAARS